MELNEKLKEAKFIKRGEKWPEIPTESCDSFCNWACVKNNGTPNSYYYCTKLGIRVDGYDSCKYYISMFDADPDLLKPFLDPPAHGKK